MVAPGAARGASQSDGAPELREASVSKDERSQVRVSGPFWGPRMQVVRSAVLECNRHQCDATGRLANFDRAAAVVRGQPAQAYEGLLFNDSDVYKVIEGWSRALALEPDAAKRGALQRDLATVVARVAAAQWPDGYINTYYTLKVGVDRRLTNERWDHETYCMGHLIEAGVEHARATGERTLLDTALRAARWLRGVYGEGKFSVPPGHQELELALVRLAKATGDDAWLGFSHELIEMRGRAHRRLDGSLEGPWDDYAQDHAPAAEQFEAAGHAVRATYMYTAMAELAARDRGAYAPALHSLWRDVVDRRMFVTGGIGPSAHNEGFTVPFDIPVRGAYQETCASIGLCLWAQAMFELTGRGEYMEQFERTLYNAVLAGVAMDGRSFFYVNPLESRGGERRQQWFSCACCPPNVLRFLAGLGTYVYGVRGDVLYVNLFVESEGEFTVNGQRVTVRQKTGYPFDGRVRVEARNHGTSDIELAIRNNGGMQAGPDGYARARVAAGAEWSAEWDIPMAATRVRSDPRVKATEGMVAFMRGPLVYAGEAVDNPGGLDGLLVPAAAEIQERTDETGVPALKVRALRASDAVEGLPFLPTVVELRPYFMWANRRPSAMRVWWPEREDRIGARPDGSVTASASFVGHGDGLIALHDRQVPTRSADHDTPRFTFWPHKGGDGAVAEWVELRFASPRPVGRIGVYWFDDTGRGECRVPAACAVEVLRGSEWLDLAKSGAGAIGVAPDTMNRVEFAAMMLDGVRLRITLQPGMSAGILEVEFTP